VQPTESANGPSIPRARAGHIPITLDVSDQSAYESYFVGALTLDEGKTIEDLRAWTNLYNYPLWVHDQGSLSAARSTVDHTTIILFEGPLYLGCLTRNPDPAGAGWLDPIEVLPLASK
jgi:hypothetical protein